MRFYAALFRAPWLPGKWAALFMANYTASGGRRQPSPPAQRRPDLAIFPISPYNASFKTIGEKQGRIKTTGGWQQP